MNYKQKVPIRRHVIAVTGSLTLVYPYFILLNTKRENDYQFDREQIMKFTILKRMVFGYVAIMLLVIFLGGYVSLKLNHLNQLATVIASIDDTIIRPIKNLTDTIFSQVKFDKKYLISSDQDFYQQFGEMKTSILTDMQKIGYLMDTQNNKALYSGARELYNLYLTQFQEEVDLMKKGGNYPHMRYQKKRENIVSEINRKLNNIILKVRLERNRKIYESSQISSHVLKMTNITAGLVITVGILISFLNTRSINRSISLLQKKTKDIAKGKFKEITNISSPPEIKELADDFNIMCKRLKELDEMKIDFINHVSHELRTPLTAIREASGMLREGIFLKSQERQQELFTIVHEECERLINSVNRILDLSCMEAKMMEYRFREIPLNPIIKKCVVKLMPIAERKKINLECKLSQDLPLVNIDEERIGQILENLLGNALKFTRDQGAVNVNAFFKNNKRKIVEVSVVDTGCGISSENLEDIFEKFKRIEGGRETVRGTGLGLSIAKYITFAHGGEIWAESEPGRGSTFFFTLPVS